MAVGSWFVIPKMGFKPMWIDLKRLEALHLNCVSHFSSGAYDCFDQHRQQGDGGGKRAGARVPKGPVKMLYLY